MRRSYLVSREAYFVSLATEATRLNQETAASPLGGVHKRDAHYSSRRGPSRFTLRVLKERLLLFEFSQLPLQFIHSFLEALIFES